MPNIISSLFNVWLESNKRQCHCFSIETFSLAKRRRAEAGRLVMWMRTNRPYLQSNLWVALTSNQSNRIRWQVAATCTGLVVTISRQTNRLRLELTRHSLTQSGANKLDTIWYEWQQIFTQLLFRPPCYFFAVCWKRVLLCSCSAVISRRTVNTEK